MISRPPSARTGAPGEVHDDRLVLRGITGEHPGGDGHQGGWRQHVIDTHLVMTGSHRIAESGPDLGEGIRQIPQSRFRMRLPYGRLKSPATTKALSARATNCLARRESAARTAIDVVNW